MSPLLVIARIWLVRLVYYLARLLPLRDRVVLATAHFDHISGNLACIQAEIARRRPDVPLVVLAHRGDSAANRLLQGAYHAVIAAYHLATSRVFIVDDYFFPIYAVRRRPGTTIIQAWHACGAFKKFGYSVADKTFGADPALTNRLRIHTNYDVCLVSSPVAAVSYAEAFHQPLSLFVSRLGIPRTDLLFGDAQREAAQRAVRERYSIAEGRRVILYAPTFRGVRTTFARHPVDLDLRLMRDVLGEDHVLLVRLHPAVRADLAIEADLAGFVIDTSDHPEVNELMLVSDVLVTDYSSVIFDFALLGRPVVLFAPDHEAYELERGFYFDYRAEGPGPVFETTRELADYLRAAEFDGQRVERFRSAWFEVADGQATRRVVDELVLPALDGTWGQA